MSLLIINPNSTEAITDGLRASLLPVQPAGVELRFFTAPPGAPTGISNLVTAVQTAHLCFEALLNQGAFDKYDGFLVCCCKPPPPPLNVLHLLRPKRPLTPLARAQSLTTRCST